MKLHAKILHHYLCCDSPVDKEGYLYKKGELNTSYQKRWFTLKGNLLFYRERPGEREALGVVLIEGCVVQLCHSDERFAFSLAFADASLRTYKFAAEDQASLEAWLKAIHSANHGFLALLLHDLRTQYKETAKAAGLEPLHGSELVKEVMSNFNNQRSGVQSGSVFYSPSNAPEPKTSSSRFLSAPISSKQNAKRSPKLWPKRPLPATTGHGLAEQWAAPAADFSQMHESVRKEGFFLQPMEDFRQLHECFGKEVRQLVEEWRKRSHEKTDISTQADLIDLG